jgi:hypothetical protein
VCITLRPSSELTGSTLLADLAYDMMGPWGRGAILFGAVMAILSSANASIMSAARIIFAMGRDRLIWDWLNAVHPRFRVPHIAILVTGVLILGCILIGNLEMLAEAAGLLHLLLYGLMGIACIVMRGARPEGYHPVYRVPGYPAVPLLAAAGCFAVAFYVKPFVALAGLGLIAFAIGHYYLVSRRQCTLRGAWPYFLRRGILEPALAQTECWGAVPEQIPTAMVALADPQREPERLQIAAGMMGPVRGEVLVVNVFLSHFREGSSEEIINKYYQTIDQRNRVLQEAAAPIIQAGGRAISHVPLTGSVFGGLVSAAEASGASLVFLGWPDRDNLRLLDRLDLHLRAHLLVLREAGPLPAGNILALLDESIHGELALLCAARLANTWNAALSVASLVEEQASHESQLEAEAALEERVGDRVRATVRAIPAPSLAATISSEAPCTDMIILGVPNGPGDRLVEAIESLGDVEGCSGCSLVLVRGYET